MSKNNYKCLINSSAPRCVIIITINTGINHSYTISSRGLNTSHHSSTPLLCSLRARGLRKLSICCSSHNVGTMGWEAPSFTRYQRVISWVITESFHIPFCPLVFLPKDAASEEYLLNINSYMKYLIHKNVKED